MASDADERDLVSRDRQAVWHPYAPPTTAPIYAVSGADGVRLRLDDGRELVDGMSSWWAAIHGYRHPAIEAAVRRQLERLPHVMFGGLTHEPAVALCERLLAIAPGGLERVFLCDSGSVAIEVAIKLALQYWRGAGNLRRSRLLTLRGGYHGDTFAAMSVCDPETGMHSLFQGLIPEQLFAERPGCRFDDPFSEDHIADFAEKLQENRDAIAAVILEPVVQGAGGMWFYAPGYLRRVRELCDEHDVLLICDEIATGFGRSGRLFACEHADVAPDILCLGKSLTGGTLSLAATLVAPRVAAGIADGRPGALLHGPTFMGNPLACAAALASIDLLEREPWQERVRRIEDQLARSLARCRDLEAVADVRVLGAIGVVELHDPVDMAAVQPAFVERGVWVRPFGRLVYVMPPYVIGPDDLATLTDAVYGVVRDVHGPAVGG